MYLIDLKQPWKETIKVSFDDGLTVKHCAKTSWAIFRTRRFQIGASAFDTQYAADYKRLACLHQLHLSARYLRSPFRGHLEEIEDAIRKLAPLHQRPPARCTGPRVPPTAATHQTTP